MTESSNMSSMTLLTIIVPDKNKKNQLQLSFSNNITVKTLNGLKNNQLNMHYKR